MNDSQLEWRPFSAPTTVADGLPYATHMAVLTIAGKEIRCYQLNDGRRIFDAKDVQKFLGMS